MIPFRLLRLVLLSLTLVAGPAMAQRPSPAPRRAIQRAGGAASPADSSASRAGRRASPRMLEDIHIEGDIPVPQVLFVTARDQRRFLEFHHHRYLRTSLQLGQATPLPTGVVVTRAPGDPGKEISR